MTRALYGERILCARDENGRRVAICCHVRGRRWPTRRDRSSEERRGKRAERERATTPTPCPARLGPARRSTLSIVGRLSTVGAPFYGRYETLTPRCHHQLADRPTDRTSIPSNNDTVRRSLAAAAISSYCRGPGKIIYGHGGAEAASTSRSRAGNMQIICGPSASVDRPAMMRFDRARLARTRGPTRPSDGLIAAAVSSLQPGPASRIVSYRIAFHS